MIGMRYATMKKRLWVMNIVRIAADRRKTVSVDCLTSVTIAVIIKTSVSVHIVPFAVKRRFIVPARSLVLSVANMVVTAVVIIIALSAAVLIVTALAMMVPEVEKPTRKN